MKNILWGMIGLSVLLGSALFVHPDPALAASGNSFDVLTSSLPLKITTPPGKTITEELRIKNLGTQATGIKVGLMKFAATGSTGTPDLYPLSKTDTYASWFHFSPQQFVAQPNVWNTVTMTIDIPSTADLGYYLAVTFSPATVNGVTGATNLNGSAANLVLLNVSTGNEKRNLNLVSFTTDHSLYEYLPANFNVTVHNAGNIYIAPSGNIFISKGTKPIATLDLNDAGGSVLPDSNRIYTVPWTDGFPVFTNKLVHGQTVADSKGKPKQTLQWNFTHANKFRFGHYTAKVLVVYDNGSEDVPTEASLGFWVIPWKLLLLVIIIVAIFGYGIFSFVRSLVRKARGIPAPIKTKKSKTDAATKGKESKHVKNEE
jgi:hypothetical protein